MESDNQNNNTPAPNPHQHGGPPPEGTPRAREQWDSTVDTRALWVVLAVAGLLAVIVFGFSMCARVAGGPGPALGDGYDVLQQRVGEAFDSNDRQQPAGGIGQSAAQPTASETRSAAQPPRMNDGDGSAAPDHRLMQDMEQQRRIMQQQEQMRDEQREAVPSILPEKPPRPVPLGGDNY